MKKLLILLIVFFGLNISYTYAADISSPSFTSTLSHVRQAVVTIIVAKEVSINNQIYLQDIGAGSGFIFTYDGYILTSNHVLFDPAAHYLAQFSNGTRKEAQIVYQDALHDVAILKVNTPISSIVFFGNSSSLRSNQPVAAIGYASGLNTNVSAQGTIYAFNRSIVARGVGTTEELNGLVETTAAITNGYSGGPLIDMYGNVIGINVAKDATYANSSFAIPIDVAKEVIRNYFNKR